MISARAMARQIGLALRTRPLRRGKVLLLRFADHSALWLSEAGARLAAPAPATSVVTEPAAYRFARAHARAQSWALLLDRKSWPVPVPCRQGDWLATPVARLNRLEREILCASALETLKGSRFGTDQLRAFLAQDDAARAGGDGAAPLAPPPEGQRRFLVFTPACLGRSAEARSAQITQLEAICAQDPTCSGVLIDTSKDRIKVLPLTKLRDFLSAHQPPVPDPTPTPEPPPAEETDITPTR